MTWRHPQAAWGFPKGELSPLDPRWVRPRLFEVIAPNANKVTLDAQGLLTGPVVEVSPGVFDIPFAGGTAQTNPNMGAVLAFRPRDAAGRIIDGSLSALTVIGQVVSGAVAFDAVVLASGEADTAALGSHIWQGMDYDGLPRGRCGLNAGFSSSSTDANGTGWAGQQNKMVSPGPTTDTSTGGNDVQLLNAVGNRLRYTNRGDLTNWAGTSVLYLSLFGSAVLGASTVRISLKYIAHATPPPGRLE